MIQRFGKKHLEDVEPEVNTIEAVAPWCSIDTSSGNLTVVLEPFNCFDAEMYADELVIDEPIEFRDDQRSTIIFPCGGYNTDTLQSILDGGSCATCLPSSSTRKSKETKRTGKS